VPLLHVPQCYAAAVRDVGRRIVITRFIFVLRVHFTLSRCFFVLCQIRIQYVAFNRHIAENTVVRPSISKHCKIAFKIPSDAGRNTRLTSPYRHCTYSLYDTLSLSLWRNPFVFGAAYTASRKFNWPERIRAAWRLLSRRRKNTCNGGGGLLVVKSGRVKYQIKHENAVITKERTSIYKICFIRPFRTGPTFFFFGREVVSPRSLSCPYC